MMKTLEELAVEIHTAKKAYWEALPKITVAELEETNTEEDAEKHDAWFEFHSLFYMCGTELFYVGWVDKNENGTYAVWGYDTYGNEVFLDTTTGDTKIGVHADSPLPPTDA